MAQKKDLKELMREILRNYNSGDQVKLNDGSVLTWNQCENPRFVSQGATRFIYINIHNEATGLHKTGIWDTENFCFVDENGEQFKK